MKSLYQKSITEEIIRLQANGFSAEETRAYLKKEKDIEPALNTIYKHRRSPIGVEMLNELIRHQERSILKADSSDPSLAMKYRADLIAKMMDKILPDLTYSEHKEDININEVKRSELVATVADYENIVQSVVDRYIREDSTTKSLDTTHSPLETDRVSD